MHRIRNGRLRRLGVFAALTVIAALAVVSATSASVDVGNSGSSVVVNTSGAEGKVFVCKYVGTPGVDERLQTGDNPISVSRQRDPGRRVRRRVLRGCARAVVRAGVRRRPAGAGRLRVPAAGGAPDRRLPQHRRQPDPDPRRHGQGRAGQLRHAHPAPDRRLPQHRRQPDPDPRRHGQGRAGQLRHRPLARPTSATRRSKDEQGNSSRPRPRPTSAPTSTATRRPCRAVS